MRMPEAGRTQVRGSLSLDEVAATPGAGDVPDTRETCPPGSYFPRLRGGERHPEASWRARVMVAV